MQYIDTPEKMISALVDLYFSARQTHFAKGNVHRGRSHTVSSQFEDLFACYLSNNMDNGYSFFVDQPISIKGAGLNTLYPDILIIKEGVATHIIDLKMDNGWNRNGLQQFVAEKAGLIEKLRGKHCKYNELIDNRKVASFAEISPDISYHVVFATSINGSNNLAETAKALESDHVKMYVLTGKTHPNEYNMNKDEILREIHIYHEEFVRLLAGLERNTD